MTDLDALDRLHRESEVLHYCQSDGEDWPCLMTSLIAELRAARTVVAAARIVTYRDAFGYTDLGDEQLDALRAALLEVPDDPA